MEYNIYRLIGIKPLSYQLPLKDMPFKKVIEKDGKKEDLGFRKVIYMPGVESFWVEDIKGDLQPQQIWFDNGDLRVDKTDKLLNSLMQAHPWYNKRYKLWSEEGEIEEKLAEKKAKTQALEIIKDSEKDQMKALALVVFGAEAFVWTEAKCELRLLEAADENPKDVMQKLEKTSDYNAKLLAGYAFIHGLVQENREQTAVVWTDSDGVIINLAKGENGINELGNFLSTKTTDSEKVLQSIGQRLQKIATYTGAKSTDSVIDEKDAEIARLREELAQTKGEDPELIKAREKYEKETGKSVPNNMKNNKDWLLENAKK